ncbi:MAG: hypothetical protein ACRD4P_13890 [Bryobacteraceae bacterium]
MIKFFRRSIGLALTLLPAGLLPANAVPAGEDSIPQFSFAYSTWSKADNAFHPIPGAGPGPVLQDPAHPVHGHPIRIANLDNPILKPWVIEKMREQNELALSGKEAYEDHAACHPTGVPGFLVSGALNPMYILQGPRKVVLINEGFAEVRHIYLDVPHSANLKPTTYGESVGHYEGDTLVVDTIGLSDNTYVDNYRTPHTTQLHVVERFKLVNDGTMLQVDVHVEDPGTFNMPWSARQTYRKGVSVDSFHGSLEGQMLEAPCEENSQIKDATYSPAPVADKSDF